MPDVVGNLFESKNRTDRKYDKGSRLIRSKHAFYKYDEEGNLIEKVQNSKTWKYIWNDAGMLEEEFGSPPLHIEPIKTFSSQFNSAI